MSTQINYAAYFEQLRKYSVGDVDYLLERFKADTGSRHAGPLLMVVVNGIDACGGILYGFGKKCVKRSPKFMKCRMDICEPIANFVYGSVRCGVTHHGMPKARVEYDVWTDKDWSNFSGGDNVFCEDKVTKVIHMNVVKFAEKYLEAIEGIRVEEIREDGELEKELAKGMEYFHDARRCIQSYTSSYGESSSSAIDSKESESGI